MAFSPHCLLRRPAASLGPLAAAVAGSLAACARSCCEDAPEIVGDSCVAGESTWGDRSLCARRSFQPGDRLFTEEASLDSYASTPIRSRVFAASCPGLSTTAEPIWGLLANYVARYCNSDGQPSVDDFFTPPTSVPGSKLYEEHAAYMHACLAEEAQSLVSVRDITQLLQCVRLNAHTVSAGREEPGLGWRRVAAGPGLGLFFWLHLANHSCAPNAFFTASAPPATQPDAVSSMTLCALRPIMPGEEVCISYVDGRTLLQPLPVRQRVLLRDFGFCCKCPRCRAEMAQTAG